MVLRKSSIRKIRKGEILWIRFITLTVFLCVVSNFMLQNKYHATTPTSKLIDRDWKLQQIDNKRLRTSPSNDDFDVAQNQIQHYNLVNNDNASIIQPSHNNSNKSKYKTVEGSVNSTVATSTVAMTTTTPICNESKTGGIIFHNISISTTPCGLHIIEQLPDEASSNRSNTAFCNMHKHQYLVHFPHYMEVVLKCWSFFEMNPKPNKVLIIADFFKTEQFGSFIKGVNAVFVELGIPVYKYAVAGRPHFARGINSTSATATLAPFKRERNAYQRNCREHFPYWMASTDHAKTFRRQFLTTLNISTSSAAPDGSDGSCSNKEFPKIAIINRKKTSVLLNLNSIVEALKDEFGVEAPVEYFEAVSFRDQVKFYSETDIIISPHGAALAGMIFMPNNGAVLEIFPVGYVKPQYFGSLSASIGLDHAYIYETDNGLENDTAYWALNIYEARKKNLCTPVSLIIEAVRQLVTRWQDRCNSGNKTANILRYNLN